MSANQTQIPSVKTEMDSLNQVQQNVNKVFRNVDNKVTNLTTSVDQLEIIGEIKLSPLTLAQFQDQAGSAWIESNGQSSVGTSYAQLTGNKTVPSISISGTNSYIKVN